MEGCFGHAMGAQHTHSVERLSACCKQLGDVLAKPEIVGYNYAEHYLRFSMWKIYYGLWFRQFSSDFRISKDELCRFLFIKCRLFSAAHASI